MSHQLQDQQQLRLNIAKSKLAVKAFLGAGTQGEVYRVQRLDSGEELALKWYLPGKATPNQKNIIADLIKRGSPDARFLWPMDTVSTEAGGFGYVMGLRENRFAGLLDLMTGQLETSLRALALAGMELSHAFLQLHARGLCYADISFGNAFFDPRTGEVRICDNDNVTAPGVGSIGVLGTPRFMAPEIVRGDGQPNSESDLFSLAVLLFYMLHVHHPLEGRRELNIRCMDLPAMNSLYGTHPLFIFDPDNADNRPVPGEQDNAILYWKLYPDFIKKCFLRTFTRGLHDPQQRVRESEWRLEMARLADAIVYCSCGAENIPDTLGRSSCWSCHKTVTLPTRLQIEKQMVMLNHDTRLYPHHLDPSRRFDFSKPLAEVTRHPTHSEMWGLKNLSPVEWAMTSPDGTMRSVPSGKSVPLLPGVKLQMGVSRGEILA